jgi:uncharacterized protein (TIGR04222 family)
MTYRRRGVTWHTARVGQPWGLSGPQFLGFYAAGIAVTIIIPLLYRQVIRFVPGRQITRELDAYEVGYLAGGPERVAEVVIAELTDSGALRVDSSGRLSTADRAALAASPALAQHGIMAAGIPDGLKTSDLRRQLKADPGVRAIGDTLRAAALAVPGPRIRALRLVTVVLLAALLVTGILRLHEGTANHRPTGDLTALFAASIIVGLVLLMKVVGTPPRSTLLGAAYLRRLRKAQQRPGFAAGMAVVGAAALFDVALLGFAAVPDADLRGALLAGMPSSSGGSSCSGGGCGGGGCGGGGCGG